jgi:hypothetical protein
MSMGNIMASQEHSKSIIFSLFSSLVLWIMYPELQDFQWFQTFQQKVGQYDRANE